MSQDVTIDDDVFEFVKQHAEPLVDDFSSTLRRLLQIPSRSRLNAKPSTVPQSGVGALPSLPSSTPQALRQPLEVTYLVRKSGYSRTDATHRVAEVHGVVVQTILDKYTRQLERTAAQFDDLLEQVNLNDLRKLLKSKFPEHAAIIDKILDELGA